MRVLKIVWTFYPLHPAYSWDQKQKYTISGYWSLKRYMMTFQRGLSFLGMINSSIIPQLTKCKTKWRISFFSLLDAPSCLHPVAKNHDSKIFLTLVTLPPSCLKCGASSWYFGRWRRALWFGFHKLCIEEGLARQLSDARIFPMCIVQLNCSSG